MKPLFDENDNYTDVSKMLDTEASQLIKPLINKYLEQGYSPRDIKTVIDGAVYEIVLFKLCGWG